MTDEQQEDHRDQEEQGFLVEFLDLAIRYRFFGAACFGGVGAGMVSAMGYAFGASAPSIAGGAVGMLATAFFCACVSDQKSARKISEASQVRDGKPRP